MELPDTWEELDALYLRQQARMHPPTCLCMYCVIVTKSCGDPRCEDLTHIDIRWRNDG